MTAEEWEEIKRIFEAALNVPESERTAFVNDLTEADTRLRQTVLELLRAHLQAESLSEDTISLSPSIGVFGEGQLVADRFRILRLLGRGGMGEVYEAFDEKLRTRIALKTLRPELVGDEDARRRFEREIRVSQQLTYDGLCRVYDLFEHQKAVGGRIPCVTMQMLEGETLQKYLERERPVELKTALPLIRQIASALNFLHERGIVHRDLKPSNIMLVPGEKGITRAVVMDFGLAKPLNSQNDLFRSSVDFQAGAPFYMAPEVLRGEAPTIQSDVFALGLIVDEMVTKSRAYPVDSVHSLFFERLWGSPIPPSQRVANLPLRWNACILRCLAADPHKRPKSAMDVVNELDANEVQELSSSHRWRIPQPARVMTRRSLVFASVGAPVASAIWLARPLSTSVVVFPVENLTPNKDHDYLCKGTSAELMSRLLRVDGLRVIPFYEPRSKVSRFPLEARFAVSGYLQDFNNRVRLIIQLVDSRDGTLIWTGTFDRKTTDPLRLQLEIAQGTFEALEAKVVVGLTQKESTWSSIALQTRHALGFQKPYLQARTDSAEALDLYMRGRHLWAERTVPAALGAIDLFKRALAADPNFALVYSAIADVQFVLMDNTYRPASDLILEARQNAERAIRIDPDLAEGHLSLAAVHQALWDWSPSEESYKKALKAGPKLARAHRWYAGFVTQFGRFDEAIQHCRIALDLDPYDYPNHAGFGLYLFLARRYKEAAETLEDTLRQKDLLVAHNVLGDTYARIALDSSGQQAQELLTKAFREAAAVAQTERAAGDQPENDEILPRSDQMYALYYAVSGDTEKARYYLDRLHAGVQARKVSPIALVEAYSVLGRQRDALAMLRTALDERDRQVLYIGVSPFLDGIRKTEEFNSALKLLRL
jgi:eukaryotic-like serine/threonine-protein kinase